MSLIIRPENPADQAEIHRITLAGFATVPYGDGTEAGVIDRLRAEGDLVLSLVAEEAGAVVGQVSLSPATIGSASGWIGLGPIAVDPPHAGIGIGTALMREALAQVSARGAAGVVLTGNPDYYGRFGFASSPDVTYLDVEERYVLRVVLNGPDATGPVTFAPALHGA